MSIPRPSTARFALRFAVPAAGVAALALFALLYRFDRADYYRALDFFGMIPFRTPFLDLQYVPAVIECWQRGIDVYVANPCDVLGRRFGYSPLWLRATFLPGKDWTDPLGLGLDIAFFLSLALLMRPRSGRAALVMLAAVLSPTTVFAVERGNIDLVMFLMALAAGLLLLGPLRRRAAGYALILLAGLLKFYPLALFALALRERPRHVAWIAGGAAAAVLAFAVAFAGELSEMAPNIPAGSFFSDLFGARNLPGGIAEILAMGLRADPAAPALRGVQIALYAALFLLTAGGALRLLRWPELCGALTGLPEPERMFLLIGAALVCGCFFAGQSIGYRGIHLLFVLPAFLVLARAPHEAGLRAFGREACVLVIVLMWAGCFTWHGFFHRAITAWPGAAAMLLPWLVREIVWWRMATLLLAILIAFASDRIEGSRHWRAT